MGEKTGKMEAERELLEKAMAGLLGDESKLKNVPFAVTEAVMRQICTGGLD